MAKQLHPFPKGLAKRAGPKPPALVLKSLAILEEEIGGRDALIAALAHAPKSRDLTYVLGLIGDPREARTPLADLCATGGITPGELIDAYKSGEINRAQAVASSRVGAKLAQVAEDTMRMSLPREQLCAVCSGLGSYVPEPTKKAPNPDPVQCKACAGLGQITVEGDLEHKKLALDMGRLLQKGGGVNVQVSQQVGIQMGSAGGALEKLQAATDQILYGEGLGVEAPVEGELVEVDHTGDAGPAGDTTEESTPEIDPQATMLDQEWFEEDHL